MQDCGPRMKIQDEEGYFQRNKPVAVSVTGMVLSLEIAARKQNQLYPFGFVVSNGAALW